MLYADAMRNKIKRITAKIDAVVTPTSCVADHDETGHHYRVGQERYSSVTTKLQVLKDDSLKNYKMNRAMEYVGKNWKQFTDDNIAEHIEKAKLLPVEIFEDAGGIGSIIHDCRQRFFDEWIFTGIQPQSILSFVPQGNTDIRIVSALRALKKFIDDKNYIPIKTELKVWDTKLKVAGTLDDVGIMNGQCVLMDLKTSNQFKDHYFFQVAMYAYMFRCLTGLKPKKCFILKLSKDNGTYQIEDLKQPTKLMRYAHNVIRTQDGIDFIKSLRKDNQKIVVKL